MCDSNDDDNSGNNKSGKCNPDQDQPGAGTAPLKRKQSSQLAPRCGDVKRSRVEPRTGAAGPSSAATGQNDVTSGDGEGNVTGASVKSTTNATAGSSAVSLSASSVSASPSGVGDGGSQRLGNKGSFYQFHLVAGIFATLFAGLIISFILKGHK